MAVYHSPIGAPIVRAEGPDKVTGRALYAADVALPGMLWGKVLRSPHPHARIRRVDASQAWKVEGVRAVVTGKEFPGHLVGRRLRDMPVLCWDKVRFVGDRVAAVAADTPDGAEEALQHIDVEYEVLPAVTDPLAAMQPDAPRLHENVSSYDGMLESVAIPEVPNGLTRVTWQKGDVEQGFREADLVLEHTFRTPGRHHGYIEPHAGVVALGADGRLDVWISTKSSFSIREQMAKAMGIPEGKIRINPVYVGGDFGGKGDAMDLPIAAFLAKQAKRPVKIVMTYNEELTAGNPTHPSVITVRTGVKKDGRLVARKLRAIHSSGAYGAFKPVVTISIGGASHAGGPYRIDHTFFEAIQVYTNTVPSGFYRAPGAPQVNFAVESHNDLIAKALCMDPAEFRLHNIIENGEENALGERQEEIKARATLQAALDAFGWKRPKRGAHTGRGMAIYDRLVGAGPTGATLIAGSDGTITIISPTFDQGVGAHTALRQIVAKEFELPVDRVKVVVGDTDTAPTDCGSGAQRVTNIAGNAVLKASSDLKSQLAAHAANILECPEEEVIHRGGDFWAREDPRRAVSMGDIVKREGQDGYLRVTANVNVKGRRDVTCYCAQVAEVQVDSETGQIRLTRFVTAHDVGTIINPLTHQGQIEGGLVQGIGMAMMEEVKIEEGRVLTTHLGDYKLPTIADVPMLDTRLVHTDVGPGPYGAKAIGEMANCSPIAAIANAVADAVGFRVYALPITSSQVYQAIQERRRD